MIRAIQVLIVLLLGIVLFSTDLTFMKVLELLLKGMGLVVITTLGVYLIFNTASQAWYSGKREIEGE